jgi:asparagine synthase (glutamine-hydrolysing)
MGFVEMPIDVAYMRSYSYYSPEELRTLVTDKHKSAVDDILKEHAYYFYKKENFDDKNRISFTDVNMFMVGLNLTYTDRASMGASVVVRTPFIDKQFSDMVMSLHGDLKLKDRTAKYILKQASKKILPEKIINRPKAAFGAPIRSWISNDLKGIVDELLSRNSIESRGLLNYDFVQKLIEDDRNGVKDNAYQIYQLLTLEYWCREFLDKDQSISK